MTDLTPRAAIEHFSTSGAAPESEASGLRDEPMTEHEPDGLRAAVEALAERPCSSDGIDSADCEADRATPTDDLYGMELDRRLEAEKTLQAVLEVVETYESCGPKQQSTRDVLAAVRKALEGSEADRATAGEREAWDFDTLANWLGDMDEARNVFDITDEATTVITIDVEELARRIAAYIPDVGLTADEIATHTYMAVEGPMFTVGNVEAIIAARCLPATPPADKVAEALRWVRDLLFTIDATENGIGGAQRAIDERIASLATPPAVDTPDATASEPLSEPEERAYPDQAEGAGAFLVSTSMAPSATSLTESEIRQLAYTFHGAQWLSLERRECVERIVAAREAAAATRARAEAAAAALEVVAVHRLHPSMNICVGCDWRAIPNAGSLRDQHWEHIARSARSQS